jgi:hypothetical protein
MKPLFDFTTPSLSADLLTNLFVYGLTFKSFADPCIELLNPYLPFVSKFCKFGPINNPHRQNFQMHIVRLNERKALPIKSIKFIKSIESIKSIKCCDTIIPRRETREKIV